MLAAFLARYGLLSIFLGAGIEGEAAAIAGGILAHKGLVPLWAAMLAAACGSCIVDQAYFFVGRHCRSYAWVDRLARKPAFDKALAFLERHPTAFILGFRFVYGMRTISPIAIGTSRIPTEQFVPLNMLAAAVWGPLFIWIGYVFGKTVDPLLSRLSEGALIAVVVGLAAAAAVGTIVWFIRRRRLQQVDVD
jgi:membrane protein DedA with SNARE-associated domain